jgi:hypothetical protein
MGYMQIAQKHKAKADVENAADAKLPGDLLEDQADPKAPTKSVAATQQPVNKRKKPTAPVRAKVVPALNNPVPGTPVAALASLLKNGKK